MAFRRTIMAAAAFASAMGVTALPAAAGGPVLVKQVPPEYPRGAERRELEGTVDLKFTVDESGTVGGIEVVGASMPGVFDSAAEKALEQWKFESGSPGEAEVTIVFALS